MRAGFRSQLAKFRPATARLRPCSSHTMMPSCISSDGTGGMPMNPNLTSALSEFTKQSEFSKSGLAAELSSEPPLHPSELSLVRRTRLRLGKLIPFAFIRFLMIFFIGVAATLAWQSYGATAREVIASWSPHLGWLAPPPAPAPASPEQLVAMSRGLAAMRQDVDKLAADITKLQAIQQGAVDRISASPPSASPPSSAVAPVRKPVPQPPAPVRAPPTR